MAFSLPKNVPRFDDSQRAYENVYWSKEQNGYGKATANALGGLFENKDLPMYKDKPYSYAASKRRIPLWKRKRTLAIAVIGLIALFTFFGLLPSSNVQGNRGSGFVLNWLKRPAKSTVDWDLRRENVRETFKLSWDGYERHAWGKDEYNPLTKSGGQETPDGIGWIITDALDTLIIMNLTERLIHARAWMSASLNYSQNYEVNTYETTSRILGGLLSAHYLSTEFPELAPLNDDDEGAPGEDLYIEKATDLADRLLGAFDSGSRIPHTNVNLETRKSKGSSENDGASSTGEVAGMQLEFKYLAKLLGEHIFWDVTDKVAEAIDSQGMEDGLLPSLIDPETGIFKYQDIGLNRGVISYYQYLIKQYFQTSKQEKVYQELWDQALRGIQKHLIGYSKESHFTIVGERSGGLKGTLSPRMDHQMCSLPGAIALAVSEGIPLSADKKASHLSTEAEGQLLLARELMKTCWTMHKITASGLAPQAVEMTIDKIHSSGESETVSSTTIDYTSTLEDSSKNTWRTDISIDSSKAQNLQSSETIESLFYMWRVTSDPTYREWGWEMFTSFVNHTAAKNGAGFVGLSDVNVLPPKQMDKMEGIWLSRTLKYFYLLFSPNDLLPLDSVVFSLGAHPFPRFLPSRGLKTGWKRKPRILVERLWGEGKERRGFPQEE